MTWGLQTGGGLFRNFFGGSWQKDSLDLTLKGGKRSKKSRRKTKTQRKSMVKRRQKQKNTKTRRNKRRRR